MFEADKVFEGALHFSAPSKGTASNPITIRSYGTGRATINSGKSSGFYAYNTAGIKIANLNFTGSGTGTNTGSGIAFYTDLPSTRLDYAWVDSVEVQGYKYNGISIGSWNRSSGYNDVTIINSVIHDTGDAGIASYAESLHGHTRMYVGHNKVYNISGLPEMESHSGNGIVLGGVDGAVIEYCEVYNNGWLNSWNAGGPVGIWGYHCNNLVIQFNESHHNRTGTSKDGGGFDIDGGCTNSIMQYNYSHDNEGAGFLVAQYPNAPSLNGVIIRFNISENDGRRNGYGGIHLWSSGSNGGIQNVEIYNNTIYLTPPANGSSPKGIYVQSGEMRNVNFRNNIIQTTGGMALISAVSLSGVRFEGNNYWSSGDNFRIIVGSTTHSTLPAWQQTGQEKHNGRPLGYAENPRLENPGQGIRIADPKKMATLSGYRLQAASEMIEKGLNLAIDFNLNPGKIDFFGNDLSRFSALSIGAHQTAGSNNVLGEKGKEYFSDAFKVELYPNPAVKDFTIRLPAGTPTTKASLYSPLGALVRQKEEIGHKLLMDVSSLPWGIYILKIESPKGIKIIKVAVGH